VLGHGKRIVSGVNVQSLFRWIPNTDHLGASANQKYLRYFGNRL
jgi:hypothetical protein